MISIDIEPLYLEEPFRILVIIELPVEKCWSSTEWVSSSSIGETPANSPVGNSSDEAVHKVLQKDVHSVLRSASILRHLLCRFIIKLRVAILNTYWTEPASRNAKPPCMKKMMIDITMRKKWSLPRLISMISVRSSSTLLFPSILSKLSSLCSLLVSTTSFLCLK